MTININRPMAGVAASILALAAAPALAQDYSGQFTFGYTGATASVDASGFPSEDLSDVNSVTLHGTIQVQFPDGFRLGARLSYVNPEIKEIDELDLKLSGTELSAGYAMANGAWFGVFSEQIDVTGGLDGVGTLPFNIGQHFYGVEGGTNVAGIAVKGFVGTGNDTTSYGVSGSYSTPQYAVGAYYTHSDVGLEVFGVDDIDLDSYGVGGVYNINQQFAVFGGVANTAVDIPGVSEDIDLMSYGIGVSYDLSNMVNLPLYTSLEYGGTRASIGSDLDFDLDGFTVSVTVPMGGAASMVPENSVAAAALNPTHSALGQAALMAF